MSMPGGVAPESPDPAIRDARLHLRDRGRGHRGRAAPDEAVPYVTLPASKPRSAFRRGLEVFLENKLAVAGVAIIVVMVVFCFIGPLFYHGNTTVVDFANETLPPAPAIRSAPTRTGTTSSPG